MTCQLYYRPISKKDFAVGDMTLRDILEKKFGFPTILNDSHVTYLEALYDANVEGADELITAIHKYEQIEIYKEC